MQHYKQYDLLLCNTMRLHCIADEVYVPESAEELCRLVQDFPDDFLILAGGSNLILPPILHRPIVLLNALPADIQIDGTCVRATASVRIQPLIRKMQKSGLGGIEYLFSVPCTVGGAVFMNAGRGEIYNQSISDYIVSVECFDIETMKLVTITKEECRFSYRHSIFAGGRYVILSALFEMDRLGEEAVETRIQARLDHAKNCLDANKPSAGSVFKICNERIMHLLMGARIGGACWSKKTANWISNDKNASYKDVTRLIKLSQMIHKLFHKSCVKEVIVVK